MNDNLSFQAHVLWVLVCGGIDVLFLEVVWVTGYRVYVGTSSFVGIHFGVDVLDRYIV